MKLLPGRPCAPASPSAGASGLVEACRRSHAPAVNLGCGAVDIGHRTQILGSGLEKRALGIQHVEKAEFAKLKALGGRVIRALRTRQNFLHIEVDFLSGSQQALVGLGKVILQAHFGGDELIFGLVRAAQGFLQIALVAVEKG